MGRCLQLERHTTQVDREFGCSLCNRSERGGISAKEVNMLCHPGEVVTRHQILTVKTTL